MSVQRAADTKITEGVKMAVKKSAEKLQDDWRIAAVYPKSTTAEHKGAAALQRSVAVETGI